MGNQKTKMSKISNILFFTILICAQIAINTKSLKNIKNMPANLAVSTKSNIASEKNIVAEKVKNVEQELAQEFKTTKAKVASPITKAKFSKKVKKVAGPVTPKKVKVAAPKKNKKVAKKFGAGKAGNKKAKKAKKAAPKKTKKA